MDLILTQNILDKLVRRVDKIKKEKIERKQKDQQLATDELIDITNFIKSVNNFMELAFYVSKRVTKYLNKNFNLNLKIYEHKPIVPTQILFPYNDELKRFEKVMKTHVANALRKLLPLFNPLQLKMVDINILFQDLK